MHARRYRTKGDRNLLPARMEKEADKAEEVPPPLRQITVHCSPRLSLHERMTRSDGNGEVRGPSIVDHGSMSIFGRRREMEDAIMQAPGFLPAYGYFAVYDGHGGSMVANLCRERMHVVLAKEVGDLAADVNEEGRWRKAMASCFAKVDREAVVAWTAGIIDGTVGATAVVAVVGEHRIVVGNCGNCRAVLCQDSDAIPLSKDHKPDRPDELQRVEAAGGKVISWNGLRIMGLLDTSRSIGNFNFRPFVISEPEVTVLDRTEKDEFLILASAGFWDVVPNDMACHLARQCLTRLTFRGRRISLRNCTSGDIAASLLARLALSRGSMSNISVVVVQLKTMENCDDYMRP